MTSLLPTQIEQYVVEAGSIGFSRPAQSIDIDQRCASSIGNDDLLGTGGCCYEKIQRKAGNSGCRRIRVWNHRLRELERKQWSFGICRQRASAGWTAAHSRERGRCGEANDTTSRRGRRGGRRGSGLRPGAGERRICLPIIADDGRKYAIRPARLCLEPLVTPTGAPELSRGYPP
jgi:hypothetical protein